MMKQYTAALRKKPMSDGEKKWQKYLRAKGYTEDTSEKSAVSEALTAKTAPIASQKTVKTQKTASVGESAFQYKDFDYGAYAESESVKNAQSALESHLSKKPEEYSSRYQSELDAVTKQMASREKFSYDPYSDPIYRDYRDRYIRDGRLAMEDTVGKASAMTGGYANSYAASAGQQQYAASLQGLGEITPELYRLALERYNAEGEALNDRYGALSNREALDYERYRAALADYQSEKEYLTKRYDTARSEDYGRYESDRSFAYGQYADGKNLAYKQYTDDRSHAYQQYTDSRDYAQKQYESERDFQEKQRQFDEKLAFEKKQYEEKKAGSANGGANGSVTDGGVILLDAFRKGVGKNEAAQTASNTLAGLADSGMRMTVNGESVPIMKADGKYFVYRKDLAGYVEVNPFQRI